MFSTPLTARRERRAARPCFRPKLEMLEDRLTPSGYSLTDLGGPPSGFSIFAPVAINNSGQIVANAANPGPGVHHAFLYSNGQWTDLGIPSGFSSIEPFGINDSGQVFADAGGLSGGAIHAFLYSNGQWTDLGIPSGFSSIETGGVSGINNSGQIVADAQPSSASGIHVVLDSNGQWTDLGIPSGFSSIEPFGINNSGQIVADAAPSSGSAYHVVLYNNGQWTDLGIPSGFSSIIAGGINNSGQIVGTVGITSNGISGAVDAFLYSNGQWTGLNSVLPTGTTVSLGLAEGINDNGQIVAQGSDGHEYLLTPQQSTGTVISDGTVSPNTLTVSNNGQQVTVSATVNTNGSPATVGNAVFSLVGPNGTVVSDGPKGVAIGSNGRASDTLTVPGGTVAGSYSLQVAYTNNSETTTQTFTGALSVTAPSTPTPIPTPTPTPPAPPVLSVPPLLSFFDSLLGGAETMNANGTETLMNSFLGFPLFVSIFDSHGSLVSVDLFGFINITGLFELLV